MPSVILYLIFIFAIFAITEQKNEPVAEIQKLLDFLAEKDPQNRAAERQIIPYYSGAQNRKRHMKTGDENNPNLMNIQTLNLYYKHNNLRNKKQLEDELEEALRADNDRICKMTGRCGCSGSRCGKPSRAEVKTVDDVDQLLNDLNKDLNNNQNPDVRLDNKDHYRDDQADNDDLDLSLNNDNKKLNEDLDIIFLEVPDSEEKLITNKLQGLGDDVKIVDLRDIDLRNLKTSNINDKTNKQTFDSDIINPEDLAQYYEEGKRVIANSLLKYVKGKSSSLSLSQLLPYQRKQLKLLKAKYDQIPIIDEDIKAQIIQILYGNQSNNKILPHPENNNIYVPQRMYDAILAYKHKNLRRAKKNLFPLTSQQKERLQNKVGRNKIAKPWRRNMPYQSYGVPFDLEIQGLGQIN